MRWITASQLEEWARSKLASRTELSKLVSDLIRATSPSITAMRFPSGDKGQVRGFDGHLVSDVEALNVPEGRSYWEFGTNSDYRAKAKEDFDTRTAEVPAEEQQKITLVLVSPWTWDSSKKLETWIADRKGESSWKDIRYLDGATLQSWLEQCPAVSAWHARNTLRVRPVDGVRSTEEYWHEYAGRFGPAVTEEVLLCERDGAAKDVLEGLVKSSGALSFVADSPDEVVAFAIAAIRKAPPEVRLFLESRTLVVDSLAAGRQLVGNETLALILRGDAARSPGQFSTRGPTLVPLGRQQRGAGVPVLNRPSGYAMGMALKSMGFEENEALTLARGCGRSLTALARLKHSGAWEPPDWLAQGMVLLPAILAGAWDSANERDREIVEQLNVPQPCDEIERRLRGFIRDNDPPFDLEGSVWKVRAPMDAFIHVGHLIDARYADRLRNAVTAVFSQVQPEVDPDAIVDLSRPPASGHSEWLREGLATTLLLLAVWGEPAEVNLGGESGQAFVDRVVRELPGLTEDHRLLTSLHQQLPLLAEAAPDPLLSALEQLLEGGGERIRPIFDEREGLLFPTARHTGVLWALETLAWDPAYFRRAVLILTRLAEIDPGGRLNNRPINSLGEIFLPWNPNTNASAAQRLAAVDEISALAPKVAWRLVKALLPTLYGASTPTARPRLREAGASERTPITYRELGQMQSALVQRAVRMAEHDQDRWYELIPGLGTFPPAERSVAVRALDITLSQLRDADRKRLWMKLREEVTRHERFRSAKWALPEEELRSLKVLVERYGPTDPITPVAWLFDTWALDDTGDMAAAAQRRTEALKQLYAIGGTESVLKLGLETKLTHLVIEAIAASGFSEVEILKLLEHSFTREPQSHLTLGLAALYRQRAGLKQANEWISNVVAGGQASADSVAALMLSWPEERATWNTVRRLGSAIAESYWRTRPPRFISGPRTDLIRALLRLVRLNRASIALQSSMNRLGEVPADLLLRMLDGIVQELNQRALVPDTMLNYYIEKGLEELDSRQDANELDIANREYALLPLLEYSNRKLRIYNMMAADAKFFHSILCQVFRGKSEPQREVSADEKARARLAYSLLMHFNQVPGQADDGIEAGTLRGWIDELRRLGESSDRAEVADHYVGRTLAHSLRDPDGAWPHRVVRDEIERLASDDVEQAIQTERFNMRGVIHRGIFEGGDQERRLAEDSLRSSASTERWPRTSALLRGIAQQWEAEAKRADVEAAQRKLRS